MNFIQKAFSLSFDLNKLKKRRIKQEPLKNLFYYGSYSDGRYFNSFEPEIVNLIQGIMPQGNVYDIGAHFGFYSLLFAELIKNGQVYSFEPNPYCLEKLKKTIELNGLNGLVEISAFGLGEEDQEAEMEVLLDNLARSTCDQELKDHYKIKGNHLVEKTKIRIKTLDNVELPSPGLIKIDVEGFEVKVVKGGLKTIGKYLPDLIIEIHGKNQEARQRNASQVLNLLKDFNYHIFHIESKALLKDLDKVPSGRHFYFSTKMIKF